MHQRNKYLSKIQQGDMVGSFKLDIKTVYDAVGSVLSLPPSCWFLWETFSLNPNQP